MSKPKTGGADTPAKNSEGTVAAIAIIVIAALLLLFTNPTRRTMDSRIGADGWYPVDYDHTDLLLFSMVKIRGFNGGYATYLGIFGDVYKMPWSDD